MIVRTLDQLKGTERDWHMHGDMVKTQRFLLKADGMSFTLSETVLEEGFDRVVWYKNHLEAAYCLEGEGTVEDLSTGIVYEIRPGTMYALDKHERHRQRALTRQRFIVVFNPALVGSEVHDKEGSYPHL